MKGNDMLKGRPPVTFIICLIIGIGILQSVTRAQQGDTFVNSIDMKFVRIRPGSFLMGQKSFEIASIVGSYTFFIK